MKSFQDLGLSPELADVLAAEGLDVPTPLQEDAVPLVLRGNNAILGAGPGSGLLMAWGAPLLDRLEPDDGGAPMALVATPTAERAAALAESLARLARHRDTVVAALDGSWALPERAHVLFATPAELLAGVRGSRLKVDKVQALVVDGASAIEGISGLEDLETLVEIVPTECQRVLASLPLTDRVLAFADLRMRRAVRLPAAADAEGPRRGEVGYRVVREPREDAALPSVATLLAEGHRHVAVFTGSDDKAADLGDHLTLHGFLAGAPGDASAPVWLAVDDLALRRRLQEMDDPRSVATLSVEVPHGADSLDRRHGAGGASQILTLARELPHLKETARISGYGLVPAVEPATPGAGGTVDALRTRIRRALEDEATAPWQLALEPLFRDHAPAEVAAALAALLVREGSSKPSGAEAGGREARTRPAAGSREPTRVRLFVSVGKKDGVGPGDVLGAVAGEAHIEGSRVGRIDIRDSYSLVEVDREVAERVIEALNGVSVKGRSVRADFDRGTGGGRGKRR